MEDDSVQICEDVSIKSEGDSSLDDGQEEVGNPGLADALAKVIRMSKRKKGQSIVLSKAKLYSGENQSNKKEYDFEIEPDPNVKVKSEKKSESIPDSEDNKPSKKLLKKLAIKKKEKLQRGRLKPSALDREKERPLVRIATRGVVQLFNAVSQQQKTISKQINKPGITEGKKEKILKAIDKKAFLDVLRGKSKPVESEGSNSNVPVNLDEEMKSEPEDEEPSWNVLREDFMLGAKLKDWDKKEIEMES